MKPAPGSVAPVQRPMAREGMSVTAAQHDLRRAYVGAGPGTLVAGMTWAAAALVHDSRGVELALAVLFFTGMLIFPLTVLICRVMLRRPRPSPGNPLGRVVLESTIAMLGGLFAAWLFVPLRPAYVFPLCAIAVGTHYAVFKTAYGDSLFWLLGALVTGVGLVEIAYPGSIPVGPIWTVAALEALFAIPLTMRAIRIAALDSEALQPSPGVQNAEG